MESLLIVALASVGLLALLGAALVFSHLCGLASSSLVNGLPQSSQAGQPNAPHPGDQYMTALHRQQMDALVADSQRMLRQSQAVDALEQPQPTTRH